MATSIVSLNDVWLTLTSRAGPVDILRGVSIEIEAGRSVSVVGPSGSGKTSLLMVLAGLERATRGQVEVTGQNFTTLPQDELARVRGANIGIVFQSFHLVPTMTAIENVALPLEFLGRSQAVDIAADLLKQVGLSERIRHFPAELSGGEQQRVALARALSTKPRLFLADEPTGNLDGKTGDHVVELLFQMQEKQDATLVLITHDEQLAKRCQTRLRMNDGRIETSTPQAVVA